MGHNMVTYRDCARMFRQGKGEIQVDCGGKMKGVKKGLFTHKHVAGPYSFLAMPCA